MHTENGPPQLGVCTAEPWLAEEWSCTADHSNAWQFCTTEWPKMEVILKAAQQPGNSSRPSVIVGAIGIPDDSGRS